MNTPLCRLRRLPPSLESLRDSEGGRSRRGGAALAREPWPGSRPLHATLAARSASDS